MKKYATLLAILLFFVSCSAVEVKPELTLIPPGRVSNQVPLDIRAAAELPSGKKTSLTLSFEQNGKKEIIFSKDTVLKKTGTVLIEHVQSIKDRPGELNVVFEVNDGKETFRKTRSVKVVDFHQRSLKTIDGAWIGMYHWSEDEGKHWNKDIKKLDEQGWRGVVRSMHEVGMDVIVLQEIFRNQEYVGKHSMTVDTYAGKAFYPSRLYPGRMDIACPDPVDVILSEAEKLGMNVFMGIGMYAWFDFSEQSLQWHKNVATEAWEMYGKYDSFYGFYVSEESGGSLDNWEQTEDLRVQRRNEIVTFFDEFTKHCRALAPTKPIMLATNSMDLVGAEPTYERLLPNLDILCPFGFARMPEHDLTGLEAAKLLQGLCDKCGSHFWFDLESFLFNPDMSLYPRDFEGIMNDLLMFDNFEKIFCYQYPGVFNNPDLHPQVGEDKSVDLYNKYREYYKNITK
jgi:hypothetical protein